MCGCMCSKVSVCRKGVLARFGKNLEGGCVMAWFGMRLVVGAWYNGMAGKNLVGGWKTVGKREDLCFSCFSLSQILN